MTVDDRRRQLTATGPYSEQPVGRLSKVEDQLARGAQHQVHDCPPADRGLPIAGNREGQVVPDVPYRGRPFPGQRLGNAPTGAHRGVRLPGPE